MKRNNKNFMSVSLPSSKWPLKPLVILAVMAFGIWALLGTANPVMADDDDQEVAREALAKGLIKPLSQLLEIIEATYSGQVLEVELESEDMDDYGGKEILIYEIKLLTPQGNVVKLKFNAKNLELLVADGHDLDKARKKHKDRDRD